MAHLVEQMAYAGQLPWHGLGKKVSPDLTPDEMLREAGLDWLVEKEEIVLASNQKPLEQQALVRSSDSSILTIVGKGWNPVQNHEAFEFFNDFVVSGNMEMHTAGSLKEGKMVWALAKVKESFSVFGDDQVDSYLLFSNPHQFGKCIDVRFTPIRVVCNNTLTYALDSVSVNSVKINHSSKFKGDMVKNALGFSKERLEMYRQQALFLGSKRYTSEKVEEYFGKVFPISGEDKGEKLSRNAKKAMELVYTQPGAKYAEGSFWQLFNAVTYMEDHVVGRSTDSRLYSAWYGQGKNKKQKGLEVALEMAKAA